jgi:hypothetical protein
LLGVAQALHPADTVHAAHGAGGAAGGESCRLALKREPSEVYCCICLDEYKDKLEALCGHEFCSACIVSVCSTNPPWNQAPCPFCRALIRKQDLRRDGQPAFADAGEEQGVRVLQLEHVLVSCGNIWLEEEIILSETEPVIITYEFMPSQHNSEVIGAFSLNCRDWGEGGCDALTWFCASHRHDFTFRGNMFETFFPHEPLGLRVGTPADVRPGEWHKMEVYLSVRQASYYVDGVLFATVHNQGTQTCWPTRGYIGMIRWASDWKFRNVKLTPAAHVFRNLESRWKVRWSGGASARIHLQNGCFRLHGIDYGLVDTTPVSFMWPDGTTQSLVSFDGRTVTWRTTDPEYPTIWWDADYDSSDLSASIFFDGGRRTCRVM